MSFLMPVYDTGITLNEVPDHISFYVEFGNCQQGCRGCHSPHLCKPVANPMNMMDIVSLAREAVEKGANAIVLMGGTTNGISIGKLKYLITWLNTLAPVCLYSGRDDYEEDLALLMHSDLTWIKTGSYQEDKGGLSSPTTNQVFLRKEKADESRFEFIDESCWFSKYDGTKFESGT